MILIKFLNNCAYIHCKPFYRWLEWLLGNRTAAGISNIFFHKKQIFPINSKCINALLFAICTFNKNCYNSVYFNWDHKSTKTGRRRISLRSSQWEWMESVKRCKLSSSSISRITSDTALGFSPSSLSTGRHFYLHYHQQYSNILQVRIRGKQKKQFNLLWSGWRR